MRHLTLIIFKGNSTCLSNINIDNAYPGQSPEFPLGHLIPQVLSASSHEVPQKKVSDGSSGSYVGFSAAK